jgi:ribosomal protein S18 acetylase RimI-like enzyme
LDKEQPMAVDLASIPAENIVNKGGDWMLVSPVPPSLLSEAAGYNVAQRATLNRIVGLPAVRADVLGHRMRPDRICIALLETAPGVGEIVGLISYRMDGAGSVWPEASRYRRRFGPLSGTARYLLTEASLRRGRPDELYLEGFKVDPRARGRGIGTNLLHWLGSEVVRRGKRAWRTEASVTADAAMRVYQGVGAKPVKTVHLGPVGQLFDRPSFVVLRWEAPGESAKAA